MSLNSHWFQFVLTLFSWLWSHSVRWDQPSRDHILKENGLTTLLKPLTATPYLEAGVPMYSFLLYYRLLTILPFVSNPSFCEFMKVKVSKKTLFNSILIQHLTLSISSPHSHGGPRDFSGKAIWYRYPTFDLSSHTYCT